MQFHAVKFDLKPLLEDCKQTMQGKADESTIKIFIDTPSSDCPARYYRIVEED